MFGCFGKIYYICHIINDVRPIYEQKKPIISHL